MNLNEILTSMTMQLLPEIIGKSISVGDLIIKLKHEQVYLPDYDYAIFFNDGKFIIQHQFNPHDELYIAERAMIKYLNEVYEKIYFDEQLKEQINE